MSTLLGLLIDKIWLSRRKNMRRTTDLTEVKGTLFSAKNESRIVECGNMVTYIWQESSEPIPLAKEAPLRQVSRQIERRQCGRDMTDLKVRLYPIQQVPTRLTESRAFVKSRQTKWIVFEVETVSKCLHTVDIQKWCRNAKQTIFRSNKMPFCLFFKWAEVEWR